MIRVIKPSLFLYVFSILSILSIIRYWYKKLDFKIIKYLNFD